jgi:hypothetical protein
MDRCEAPRPRPGDRRSRHIRLSSTEVQFANRLAHQVAPLGSADRGAGSHRTLHNSEMFADKPALQLVVAYDLTHDEIIGTLVASFSCFACERSCLLQ